MNDPIDIIAGNKTQAPAVSTTAIGASASAWFGDVVDLAKAYTDDPAPRDDVLVGLEPGNVVCIGAPGGGSKTLFVLSLAHDLALGGKVESVITTLVPAKGQTALLLTSEESVAEISRRVHRFGALLDSEQRRAAAASIEIRSMKKTVPILIDRDGSVNMTTHALLERASYGRRMVALDPLGRFVRADKNDEATMVTLVTVLEEIAQRVGCVFCLPHHVGKNAVFTGNGGSAMAMKGSTALVDSCRMALMIFRPSKATAEARKIEASRFRIVKIDKANYRADKGEIWFRVRSDGTLAYDEGQTIYDDASDVLDEIARTETKPLIVLGQPQSEAEVVKGEIVDEDEFLANL